MIEKLLPIFRNVFNNNDLTLSPSTTSGDVNGWDSLAHIKLIVAIEKSFGVRFTASEISDLENVGHIADLVHRKQNNLD